MDGKAYIVYKATHEAKGSYIGCSSMGLSTRASCHRSAAKGGSATPFHTALRATKRAEWLWECLACFTSPSRAWAEEARQIVAQRPALNVKEGQRWPAGYAHGGRKNRGRVQSDETRLWFKKFHSTRVRTRKHDRKEMFRLQTQGLNQNQIAKILKCNQALVSRVLRGDYKL